MGKVDVVLDMAYLRSPFRVGVVWLDRKSVV